MYLGQHFREVGDDWKVFCYWLEDILLWLEDRLEDRLEDIPFSSLSSSLYCVYIRVLRRFWEIWQIFSCTEF